MPEVLETPLLERIDLRPWMTLGLGVLASIALILVALALFPSDESSTASGEGQLAGAAIDDPGPERSTGAPLGDSAGTGAISAGDEDGLELDGSSAATLTITTTTEDQASSTVAPSTTTPTSDTPTSDVTAPTVPPTTAPTASTVTTFPAETTTPSSTETTEASTTTTEATTSTVGQPGATDPAIQQAVLEATNAERVAAGCPVLRLDPTLNRVADAHSADMAARGFFAHVNPEGQDAVARAGSAGYPGRSIGETIAVGQRTAEQVVANWMASADDRATILDCSFEELGVGFARGPGVNRSPGRFWTQVLGSR